LEDIRIIQFKNEKKIKKILHLLFKCNSEIENLMEVQKETMDAKKEITNGLGLGFSPNPIPD